MADEFILGSYVTYHFCCTDHYETWNGVTDLCKDLQYKILLNSVQPFSSWDLWTLDIKCVFYFSLKLLF
jgi:hypothetical protein